MLDLVVVGGGPAGLLTAARCAEAGLNVLVLEEHAAIGEPIHCTGIVSLEIADLAKVPDELVLNRLTRARITAPGDPPCMVEWDAPPGEQILVIDRGGFDRQLAAQARTAGAGVETRARVVSVTSDRWGVAVGLDDRRTFRARACVLACGVTYRFQRALGLGLPGDVIHTAQTEIAGTAPDAVELWFGRAMAPEGFVWAVPVTRSGNDSTKVGVLARGDAAQSLRAFLEGPGAGYGDGGAPEVVQRILPMATVGRTYAERLVIVGDAGGFTKPTTGGGIFYSLLTASLAASTLVEAFQAGRLDASYLARYEDRWRSVLGHELRVGRWFRRLLRKATDTEIAVLLTAIAADDVRGLVRRTARFNWHRDVIAMLASHPGIAGLLMRLLLR